MSKLFLPVTVLLTVILFSGCAWGKKKSGSSSHLYEGDAPSIHYTDKPEAAGGPLNPS